MCDEHPGLLVRLELDMDCIPGLCRTAMQTLCTHAVENVCMCWAVYSVSFRAAYIDTLLIYGLC